MNAPTSALGKYRLVAELGEGGMAHVYLAVVQGPGGFAKLQVVKRIRGELAEDPEFVTMFMEEARLAARLNHPNIVQTNEVGSDEGRLFIAMEYLDGQSFEAMLRRAAGKKEPIPLAYQLRVIIEALAGLQHAHDLADYDGTPLHVVHRDVSPHNVFVTYDGQIKLVDFGIAKAADGSLRTRTGVFKGKCAYMAVEQFDGAQVDRRADVFSVGAMLWQTATGRRLWRGLTDMQIYAKLGRGEIPSVLEQAPDADPRLAEITMKALAPRREDRYPTAAALAEALEALLEARGERASARDVGRWVAENFSDRRAQIRKAIELQLKGEPSDPTMSGEVPVLSSLVPEGGDASGPSNPSRAKPPPSGVTPAAPTHSGARLTAAGRAEADARWSAPTRVEGMASDASIPAVAPSPSGRARSGAMVAIVAALVVAALSLATTVVLILARGRDRGDPSSKVEKGISGAGEGEPEATKAANKRASEPLADTSATASASASASASTIASGAATTTPSATTTARPTGPRVDGTGTTAGAAPTEATTKPTAKPKPTLDESDPWK
jgi:serine/threonine-protein kinase